MASPPRRVLVVDDDDSACSMYATALRFDGFYVRTAADGLSALRLLEAFEFDAVILDLHLPVASGFEVLHELRSALRRQTGVVAISGDDRGLALARRNPGFRAALQKPVEARDLVEVTRRVAFRSRAGRGVTRRAE